MLGDFFFGIGGKIIFRSFGRIAVKLHMCGQFKLAVSIFNYCNYEVLSDSIGNIVGKIESCRVDKQSAPGLSLILHRIAAHNDRHYIIAIFV